MDGGELEVENVDPEQRLLEDACTYLTSKQYPAHVTTKNEKRSMRQRQKSWWSRMESYFTRNRVKR